MISKSSPELTLFYYNVKKWIDGGYRSHPIFKKKLTLCEASILYSGSSAIKREMANQFFEAKLDKNYPFNGGSKWKYEREGHPMTSPLRIQWINDRLKDMEE